MPISYRRISYGKRQNQNQGGGSKLQGLPAITNMSVLGNRAARFRAGGERRNYFFLINQLSGGVGKMYSANSGRFDGARGTPNGPGPWGNNGGGGGGGGGGCCPYQLGDPNANISNGAMFCPAPVLTSPGGVPTGFQGYLAAGVTTAFATAGQLTSTKFVTALGEESTIVYLFTSLLANEFTLGVSPQMNQLAGSRMILELPNAGNAEFVFENPGGGFRDAIEFIESGGGGAVLLPAESTYGTIDPPNWAGLLTYLSGNNGTNCSSFTIKLEYRA